MSSYGLTRLRRCLIGVPLCILVSVATGCTPPLPSSPSATATAMAAPHALNGAFAAVVVPSPSPSAEILRPGSLAGTQSMKIYVQEWAGPSYAWSAFYTLRRKSNRFEGEARWEAGVHEHIRREMRTIDIWRGEADALLRHLERAEGLLVAYTPPRQTRFETRETEWYFLLEGDFGEVLFSTDPQHWGDTPWRLAKNGSYAMAYSNVLAEALQMIEDDLDLEFPRALARQARWEAEEAARRAANQQPAPRIP